jgi:hypothetical protein
VLGGGPGGAVQSGPLAPSATAAPNATAVQNAITAAINALIGGAPGALNALNELASALGNDANFAATTAAALAGKLAKGANLSDLTDAAAARTNIGLGGVDNVSQAAIVAAAKAASVQNAMTPSATVAPSVNAVVAHVSAQVAGIVAAGAPIITTFAAAVPFDSFRTFGLKVVDADIAFSVDPTGAIDYGETQVAIQANGANNVTFDAGLKLVGSQAFDNTNNQINLVTFFRQGGRYYYTVALGALVTVPVASSAQIPNANPDRVYITWSIPMDADISLPAAFTLAGKTISAHTLVDSTHSYATVTVPYAFGDTPTLAYTKPSTHKMRSVEQDEVSNFSGLAITNNIAATTSHIRFDTTVGAHVVESGNGTTGWIYTGSVDAFIANGPENYAYTSKSLGSTVNGYLLGTLTGSPNTGADTASSLFGLTATRALFEGAVGYCIGEGHSLYKVILEDGVIATPNGATGVVPTAGDLLRITRTGSTIVAEVSQNSGGTWTTIHTWTGASTGVLYGGLALGAPGSPAQITDPRSNAMA